MQKTERNDDAFALIRRCAGQAPSSIALQAPGRKPLTYAQLLDQMARTQEALHHYGVGPNEVVALALPDGPEMVTAVLGVGQTRACAPLNPSLAAAEFESYLSSLRPAALLAPFGMDSAATAAARAVGVPVLDLCSMPDAPAGIFTVSPRCGTRPEQRRIATDVAILLFTSATTGKAKLVPLSHSNLKAICHNANRALRLSDADRFLSLMPLFHLQGLASVLPQLSVGGSAACTSAFDPDRFLTWMSEFQPTWYTAGPALHHTILSILDGRPLPCALRFVRSIGAPLAPDLLSALERALGVPVLEGYGLTECGLVTSNPFPPRRRIPGSVGVRLATDAGTFDASGLMLKPGQEGEIGVRGPAVTSGYLHPEDANLTAFRGGWFRTGDLGRFDENGYLYITGRLKDIINRGGEKIMPQEVDRVLTAHSSVAEATAFGVPHATLGEDILAAVVLHPGARVSELELQDFAAQRLARFKVPRRILFLDHIPKGTTGKPNRVALSEQFSTASGKSELETGRAADPFVGTPPSDSVGQRPHAQLEGRLATIWAEVLGISAVGSHDNFFELGGHSLMATRLLARIEQAFGKKLSLDVLFHAPTIHDLARVLRDPGDVLDFSKIVPIQPEGSKSPFFMVRPLPIFRPLAHRLPGDRPFLGVSLPERQELPQQYGVRDVARELVRVVRRWQPFGPYYLGGWCADGVVAYEMACQIEAQGNQVAVLALFDSLNPAYMKGLSPWQSLKQRTQLLVWNSRFHLASLRQLGKSEIPGYIGQRLAAVLTLARRRLSGAFRYATRSEQSQKESEWRPSGLRVWIRGYQPKPVAGPVVLFRSAGWRSRPPEDPSFGWGALVSHRLTIHQIPGNHLSIFLEPNVGVLAEKLAAHLAETTPADVERPSITRPNENKS